MAQGTSPLSDVFQNNILVRIRAGQNIPRATFTRADATSCATYIKNDGLVYTAAANVLRTEWVDLDGDGVRETPGLLLEGSRTNLIENGSYEADTVGTTANISTIVRDATNVRVGSWALKVTTTNASNSGCFWGNRAGTRIAVTVGQPYTHSIWIYAPAASVGKIFQITLEWYTSVPAANGVSASGNLVLVAGWQRVSWTGTPPASTATVSPTFYTNGAQGVFDVWVDAIQIEAGTFMSSAIPTGTVAVTRAADSLTLPFNFGPQDTTVLARIARPVHADASGNLGNPALIWRLGSAAVPIAYSSFQAATRFFNIVLDTAGTDTSQNIAIPAGATINVLSQVKNPATAGQVAIDVGGGLSAFSAAASGFGAYGNQILNVASDAGQQLYGVLLDLVIARGLYSLQRMLQLAGRDT